MTKCKCDIKIMASPKRAESARNIALQLGLSENDIFFDDRPNGGDALYTARKTWMLPFEDGITHRLVLQDDIKPCIGLVESIQRIVNAHPDKIIAAYSSRVEIANLNTNSPYVEVIGGGVWGQAVIIPREIIPKIFEWVDEINPAYKHDDGAISEYARYHGVTVLLTRFDLVQHLCPTESLLKYNNKRKYSKTYIDGADYRLINWESKAEMPRVNIRSCVSIGIDDV